MTIRDGQKYLESLWDWGFLDDCFTEEIKVTDLDGLVERNGKFLVIETKLPNIEIPKGQRTAFFNLMKTGLFTILVVWGHPNNPIKAELYNRKDRFIASETFEPFDLEEFHDLVEQWFIYADYK